MLNLGLLTERVVPSKSLTGTKGFSGDEITCNLRKLPRASHSAKKAVKYLRLTFGLSSQIL